MITPPTLIADIGGTNARFALASSDYPYFTQAKTLQCAKFESIELAIEAYLESLDITSFGAMCFAIAGPIRNQTVDMTNHHWRVNGAELCLRFNAEQCHLLNDFESTAYGLTKLSDSDLLAIGGGWSKPNNRHYTVGVVGPGSGLGVAGLCVRDATAFPLATEGGHLGFAPADSLQSDILTILQDQYGRVSNERLLSGPGLINIHNALSMIYQRDYVDLSAAEIANSEDHLCQQAFGLFFEILGQVSGDIALAIGAEHGIYIGGGIVQRYPEKFAASNFRRGFEHKGRYQTLMQDIPTWLITNSNPGLIGAASYAIQHFR